MPVVILSGHGVIIGQLTLREVLAVDGTCQLKALVKRGSDDGGKLVLAFGMQGPRVATPSQTAIAAATLRGRGTRIVHGDDVDEVTQDPIAQMPAIFIQMEEEFVDR